MIRHTVLREYVSDRQKAHKISQHSRCWIDTKRNRLVSCHGPGHEPGAKIMLRQMAAEAKIRREHTALTCALLSVSRALSELHEAGEIGSALIPRILGEASQIVNESKMEGGK